MTIDRAKDAAEHIVKSMAARDPFRAAVMLIGVVFLGWYIYNQQLNTERFILMNSAAVSTEHRMINTLHDLALSIENAAELDEWMINLLEKLSTGECINVESVDGSIKKSKAIKEEAYRKITDAIEAEKVER